MPKPHVSLNVGNVERSVAFYRQFFGVEPVKLKPDYAKFDLADPPLNFTMNERQPVQDGEHGRLAHLGIQVEGHEAVARTARNLFPLADKASDEPTADLLTQRLTVHEQTAWMLRSLLEE